ncbi:DNA-directed DNA polymerase alpha catalytic subunit pol1 [Polyrhizophydium stewartii]|uniref:Centrosomal protein of 70 kDa n=1 Tax=Polyrhizophydium stewartii TaxID=2732419 RepID=A0ABR4N7H6_9FUNG
MLPDIPRLSSYTKSVQGALASAIATAPRPAGPARSDPPQPHGVAGISSTALNDSISPLADVSLRMVELGLPPVPQSLINSSPTADTGAAPPSLSPVTLRAPQADDLVKYLFKLAGEIAHRDRTIEAVKNRLIQTDAAASASREKLAAELDEARAEAESLRRQAEAAASQRQSDRREVDSLRFRLKELQAQQESAAQRDLRSLARFKQKYSQPYMQTAAADGSDAVMLEIIRAYELKIDTLQKQIDSQQPSGPASTTQSAQLQQQQQQKPSLQSSNSNELEAQLANTIKSLEDAKRQNEALKLELTNTSKNGWIHDAAREQMMSQMSTRDLIRRDKKLWRTKLAYIDTLSREQACELLKDICIKLSIRQITQIPLCVERIRVVMRLVGQMEAFIREVDTIVTAHTAGTSDARAPDAPHKLSHLVGVIRSWAENAADAADLKAFSNRVHNELQIQRREGVSPLLCLERLRLLVRASAQSKPQTAEQQAQSTDFFVQFCQLYKVETHKEALTAMNNMFILQQEVESGLDRLRQALGADVKVQPIRLLVNAAEVLEKMHAEAHKSREYALGDGLVTPSDGGASRARTHSNLAQQHKRADRAYGAGVEEQLGEYERGKGEPAADARAADRWSGLARAGVTQADAVPTLASAGVSRLSGVGRPTGRVGAVVGGLSMLLGKTVLEDDDNVLADTSIDRSVSHSE